MKFTKAHANGNDFVIIDCRAQSFSPDPKIIRRICDRHYGIGCDQVLCIEPPARTDIDYTYRIFNVDGSEVFQCGNGLRAVAHYLHTVGNHTAKTIRFGTLDGKRYETTQADNQQITVNMGPVSLLPITLPLFGETHAAFAVDVGNPHCVLPFPRNRRRPLDAYVTAIQKDTQHFPAGVNVSFYTESDRQTLYMRIFERGVGETLSCGSGACAVMASAYAQKQVDNHVTVHQVGGELTVKWAGGASDIWLQGTAAIVFSGEYYSPSIINTDRE